MSELSELESLFRDIHEVEDKKKRLVNQYESIFSKASYQRALDKNSEDSNKIVIDHIESVNKLENNFFTDKEKMTEVLNSIPLSGEGTGQFLEKHNSQNPLMELQALPNGRLIFADSALKRDCSTYKDIISRTSRDGLHLTGKVYSEDYLSDAIRVENDNAVIDFNTIYDNILINDPCDLTDEHHRDAIQLIPQKPSSQYYDHFASAMLQNVTIHRNTIDSVGKLQGIFSSDGLHKNLTITSNVIKTGSSHEVSINGMLSGTIKSNTGESGLPATILLEPLRLGGNLGSGNRWILSMRESEFAYGNIEGVSDDIQSARSKIPTNKDGFGFKNFPLKEFRRIYNLKTTTLEYLYKQSPQFEGFIEAYINYFKSIGETQLANDIQDIHQNKKWITIHDIHVTALRVLCVQEIPLLMYYADNGIELVEN